MRIGLFMTPQWAPGADLAGAVEHLAEQVRAARESGFTSLLVGHHYVTAPMQMFQPVPLIARLLEHTEGMQVGPGVLLLPMTNPVAVAEEWATLDWLSDGRCVLAVGLGYRAEEFEVSGTLRRDRVPRLVEALAVIERLWTEERVTHHGRFFTLTDVGASVRPKQQPRPPIWLGGDVEPAVRRAARLGDAWLGSPTATLEGLAELRAAFLDERERAGRPAVTGLPLIRECFVGRDDAHARSVSRGPLLYKYEAYASWGTASTDEGSLAERFDDFSSERFLVGDAASVRDGMQRYADALGIDHLLLRAQWPGLDQSDAIENIRRIGAVAASLG
jgi:alkanesulfonate monooxygenase SsuD/methylene tetrahydromethanopterin reductase-like flavin-dependent oxidoreductase (luciferase family)